MPHFITEKCIGCDICKSRCPMKAIFGVKKEIYKIVPDLCIDCSVCGRYCPYSAIQDNIGKIIIGMKHKDIPRAKVIKEYCSGCETCISICPFESIILTNYSDFNSRDMVASVNERRCVGCRLCEQICIKGAICVVSS